MSGSCNEEGETATNKRKESLGQEGAEGASTNRRRGIISPRERRRNPERIEQKNESATKAHPGDIHD